MQDADTNNYAQNSGTDGLAAAAFVETRATLHGYLTLQDYSNLLGGSGIPATDRNIRD